ncbi:MAG: hypothetical protein EBS96_14250, partial [Spartobacteria bacterium]|nr:hypothetical protein [Spartobacteria bacterium]
MAGQNTPVMKKPTPTHKETLALLRHEIVCHIKTLRGEGLPLVECVRAASLRPWPAEGGRYFAARTLETWWYDYTKSGFAGITGKAKRQDAGKSRALDEELGLWII